MYIEYTMRVFVPLVGNIFTIGKEIRVNGKIGNAIGINGTNVTNQWYHWENPEHTHCLLYNNFTKTVLYVYDIYYITMRFIFSVINILQLKPKLIMIGKKL